MPLLQFWKSDPDAVSELTIEQIVGIAGDGRLRDGSPASIELRDFLSQIPSSSLGAYAQYCLVNSFANSGWVLQDIVNELGRRLDYRVEHGRYQGTTNAVGFDGLWRSPEGHELIVEVKTTDAYRISLDTIAGYRRRLSEGGSIAAAASALIVVGRQDTGELEAQIRGSRHAWDMRLISVEALLALLGIQESTDDDRTGAKIRSVLLPREYTRLDALVDVMFTTAKDIEVGVAAEGLTLASDGESVQGHTQLRSDTDLLRKKRDEIVRAVAQRAGLALIQRTRALYWDDAHTTRVACTISKRYDAKGPYRYWYAYHPKWDEFLSGGALGLFILGGIDVDVAFVLPYAVIHSHLDELSTTPASGLPDYWHIHIHERRPGEYTLDLPKRRSELPLSEYRLVLGPPRTGAPHEQ